jgi:hypothetical protein
LAASSAAVASLSEFQALIEMIWSPSTMTP